MAKHLFQPSETLPWRILNGSGSKEMKKNPNRTTKRHPTNDKPDSCDPQAESKPFYVQRSMSAETQTAKENHHVSFNESPQAISSDSDAEILTYSTLRIHVPERNASVEPSLPVYEEIPDGFDTLPPHLR